MAIAPKRIGTLSEHLSGLARIGDVISDEWAQELYLAAEWAEELEHAIAEGEQSSALVEKAPRRSEEVLGEWVSHALQSANEICRSAWSIAERNGKEVNWESFRSGLSESLKIQHIAMYPPPKGRSRNES